MQPKHLAQQFADFLNQLRNMTTLEGEAREAWEEALNQEYRRLHKAFARLNDVQVGACMAAETGLTSEQCVALRDHLGLGRGRVMAVQLPLVKLMQADPGRTDWAISAFMNRHAAYQLVHGETKESEADAESKRLLATMLGLDAIELSEGFVRKMRTELLAGCLAYAHARRCQQDMERWKADAELQAHFGGNVEDYLLACIERAQAGMYYGTDTSPSEDRNPKALPIACVIQEHPVLMEESKANKTDGLGQTAERLRADACVVNHAEKLIVIGGATTNLQDNAKQLISLARLTQAAEMMVQHNPRYAGYQVRPFFLHGGYFSADPDAKKGARGQFIKQLRDGGMPQESIEALARMAFYSMLSERQPSPERGDVFLRLNPHIAGCNTLPQYQASEEARAARSHSRAPARAILADLDKALEAVLHPAFDLTKTGVPRESIVHGLVGALQNFYILFPVEANQRLSREEAKQLEAIAGKLGQLSQKLQDVDFGAAEAQCLSLSVMLSPEKLAWWVQSQLESSRTKPVCEWSETTHQKLLYNKNIFNIDPRALPEMAIEPFLAQVAKGAVPDVLEKAVAACLSPTHRVLLSDREAELLETAFEELRDLARDAGKGYPRPPRERDGGMGGNASFVQTLRNAAAALNQGEDPDEPTLPGATFRLLAAFFQMDHAQLTGTKPSQAFLRAGPAFLRACLMEDADLRLSTLALARLDISVAATVPCRGKRGMG